MTANRWDSHSPAGTNLVQANRNPTPLQPKGRICTEDGCGTQLSVYNKGDVCGMHENPRKAHPARWLLPGT